MEDDKEQIHDWTIEAARVGSEKVVKALIDLNNELGHDWVEWSDVTKEAALIGRLDIIKIVYNEAVDEDDGKDTPYHKLNDEPYWTETIEIAQANGHQEIVDWFKN